MNSAMVKPMPASRPMPHRAGQVALAGRRSGGCAPPARRSRRCPAACRAADPGRRRSWPSSAGRTRLRAVNADAGVEQGEHRHDAERHPGCRACSNCAAGSAPGRSHAPAGRAGPRPPRSCRRSAAAAPASASPDRGAAPAARPAPAARRPRSHGRPDFSIAATSRPRMTKTAALPPPRGRRPSATAARSAGDRPSVASSTSAV